MPPRGIQPRGVTTMNNLHKTCQGCGIQFKPNYPTQRFHSRLCSNTCAEHRAINREARLERWRNDTEYRALMVEAARKLWQKPEYRALMVEVARKLWRNNEYRARRSEMARERWRNNPESRALMVEAARKLWQKPEFRAQMTEVLKANNIRLAKRSAAADSANDRD